MDAPATLLVAAHGTRSVAGRATSERLVAAVAAARPGLDVDLCFLDVVTPSLREALEAAVRPTVVVPLLLSAGFHVRSDIPAIVAERLDGPERSDKTGRPDVVVAGHLGADPLVIEALIDRLVAARGPVAPQTTLLARVGSTRTEAGAEFTAARTLLARRLGRPVGELRLDDDVQARLAALPGPVEIGPYLLAEGDFLEAIRSAATGVASVADPIGVHPALVRLVLARYDAAGR